MIRSLLYHCPLLASSHCCSFIKDFWHQIHDLSHHLTSWRRHPGRFHLQESHPSTPLSHNSGTPTSRNHHLTSASVRLLDHLLEEVPLWGLQFPSNSLMPSPPRGEGDWRSLHFLLVIWLSPKLYFCFFLFGVLNYSPFFFFPFTMLQSHWLLPVPWKWYFPIQKFSQVYDILFFRNTCLRKCPTLPS